MEKLLFQKNINLEYPLHELVSVSVKDNLNYLLCEDGKRAIGSLNIEGEYIYQKSKYRFEDMIEIDILAPFDRLNNDEDFCVEIDDYDYHVSAGLLDLEIHVNAYGVLRKEDRHIVIDDEQERYNEIKALMEKEELIEVIEETIKTKEDVLNIHGKSKDELIVVSQVEDEEIYDDDLSGYITYPYYICKNDDDYHTIAEKMNVEEALLRSLNENRDIKPSCIIRLKK